MGRWSPWIASLVVLLLMTACAQDSNESRAFLSRYSAEWQLTPSATSPTATPMPTTSGAGAAQSDDSGHPPILVYLDAGHGGVDRGAGGTDYAGKDVNEKTLTLAIAQQTARRLENDGIGVVLSRTDDTTPEATPSDYSGDGTAFTAEGVLHDLQHRVDRANASGARLLLSIHFNAFSDPSIGGSETFYDAERGFADQNQRFARLVQSSVIASLRSRGLHVADRGVTDDSSLIGDDLGTLGVPYHHLVLLGPAVPGRLRASQMPGALSEPLFLSNPVEANAAGQPETLEAISSGYVLAVEQYLRN